MINLYGLTVTLPAAWHDSTEYFFTSAGPILALPLSVEPYTAALIEEWLAATRDKARSFPNALLLPVRTHESSRFLIRGFEASFGARGSRLFIAVSLGERALVLVPKCRGDFAAPLQHILSTLRYAGEPALEATAGTYHYSVLGFWFESLLPLEPPASFRFDADDGTAHILGLRASELPPVQPPEWRARFDLGLESALAVTSAPALTVEGQANAASVDASLLLTAQHWLATAEETGSLRRLAYADARTRLGAVQFDFRLFAEGSEELLLTLWYDFLRTARRS